MKGSRPEIRFELPGCVDVEGPEAVTVKAPKVSAVLTMSAGVVCIRRGWLVDGIGAGCPWKAVSLGSCLLYGGGASGAGAYCCGGAWERWL